MLMSNNEENKPRRRKRRGSGKHYFTQVHEDAIVQYCKSTDRAEREHLYRTFIGPALNEMVDKIVYTYKFTNLPNIHELQDECKIWLTTILDKFDQSKGSKAFSYFSVVTKNWFIHKVKKHQFHRSREILLDDVPKSVEQKHMAVHNPYLGAREAEEFRQALWSEIRSWGKMPMKPNEERVYEAVKILLADPDSIEIFNKKAIYLYLREITGLNTKQVVNNLNKLRSKYKVFRNDWNEGNVQFIEEDSNNVEKNKTNGEAP
jgi:hypothetical protein